MPLSTEPIDKQMKFIVLVPDDQKSGRGVRLSVFRPLVWTVGGLLVESTVIRFLTVLLQQVSYSLFEP